MCVRVRKRVYLSIYICVDLSAAGSHPTPGRMICADFWTFISTPCGRAKTNVHVPLDCPPGPGPPSGASLGGPTMGQIGWGGPSTGPTLLFGAAGVSPCRFEPLWASCWVGGGVRCFVGVNLSSIIYLYPCIRPSVAARYLEKKIRRFFFSAPPSCFPGFIRGRPDDWSNQAPRIKKSNWLKLLAGFTRKKGKHAPGK